MMKKVLLFFALLQFSLVFSANKMFAQLLVDNFDYTVGDPITDYNWIANGNPGINTILVVAPGLDFPCYEGSGVGNAVALNSSGPDAYKLLSGIIDSGSAYVSFMVRITSAQTGDYFFHLSDSTGGFNSDIGRVYVKDSSGLVAFGINKEGNNNEVWTPHQYQLNTTYLILLKYTFVAGDQNDLISLYVFDDCPPILEPLPTVGPTGVGQGDLPEIGKVTLRQGAEAQAPTLIIDGIYAETSWEEGPLPVELTAFYHNVIARDVVLTWTTASEINNAGFDVERRAAGSNDWTVLGNVAGIGTSNVSHKYSYTDRNLETGRYNYRIKQIDFNGNISYFNLNSEILIGTPTAFDLRQNYPNPFNPTTKIGYDIPSDGIVSVKIFDYLGREVSSLVNEFKTAGYYTVDFNALNLSSGIYFYKLESNGFSKVMKMTLVK